MSQIIKKAKQRVDEDQRRADQSNGSIERLKDRSRSRNKMIEEKLNSTVNQIKRQPTQLLQQAGAYRSLRKSQQVNIPKVPQQRDEMSPSFVQMRDSFDNTMFRDESPTPQRSFIENLRKKSAERTTSNNRQSMNTAANKGLSIVQKLSQMSKSRSRSRSGNPGVRMLAKDLNQTDLSDNKFKTMEQEMADTVKNKTSALQQNMQIMKERLLKKNQTKESQLWGTGGQNLGDHATFSNIEAYVSEENDSIINSNILMTQPPKIHSPFQMRNGLQDSLLDPRRVWSGSIPRRASASPPSFRNNRESRQSFGRTPGRSNGRTPGRSPIQSQFNQNNSPIKQNQDYMGFTGGSQTLGLTYDLNNKMANAKSFIHYIINLIENIQQGVNESELVLAKNNINELRLKLTGAFERLEQIPDQYNQCEQLLGIMQNFLSDIFQKVQRNMIQGDQVMNPTQSYMMQSILQNLLDQITQYEFHDALPQIARALHDLRVSLGVQKLQSMHNEKINGGGSAIFNIMRQNVKLNKDRFTMLRKAFKRHLRKHDQLSVQNFFSHWKLSYQKQFRVHQKTVVEALNAFNEKITETAPQVNYADSQGLPDFSQILKELMVEVLGIQTNQNKIFVEIIFINKSGTVACAFERTEDGAVIKHEIQIQDDGQSLMKHILHDGFIQGKKLAPACFQNILSNKQFNSSVDMPFLSKPKQLEMMKQGSFSQAIFPLVTPNLKNIKLAIRLSSHSKKLIASSQAHQFHTFNFMEASSAILKGLSNFKNLSKQFSDFHHRLAKNADQTFISERTLQQLQYINETSLEMSHQLSVSQIFDLLQTTVVSLVQCDRAAIIKYKNGNVWKMYDNTKVYDQLQQDQQNHKQNVIMESQGQTTLWPKQIGLMEESNEAIRDKMREMGQLSVDGACPPWVQILLEQHDSLDITGKAIKDIVLIPITQLNQSNMDVSRITTNRNYDAGTSYAWDTASNFTSNMMNRSQIAADGEIYLLKIEKKLLRVSDQEPFDQILDTKSILKTLRSLLQIGLTKLNLVTKEVKERADHMEKSISENNDFLKLTDQNAALKKQVKLQKIMNQMANDYNQMDSSDLKFNRLEQNLKQVVQDYIPNAKLFQLFLAKQNDSHDMYTYVKQINGFQNPDQDHGSSFASLIRAQGQSVQQDLDTIDPRFKTQLNNQQIQQTAGFKNNESIDQKIVFNFNKPIDDISSIEGSNDFVNLQFGKQSKIRYENNQGHLDSVEDENIYQQRSPDQCNIVDTNNKKYLQRSVSQRQVSSNIKQMQINQLTLQGIQSARQEEHNVFTHPSQPDHEYVPGDFGGPQGIVMGTMGQGLLDGVNQELDTSHNLFQNNHFGQSTGDFKMTAEGQRIPRNPNTQQVSGRRGMSGDYDNYLQQSDSAISQTTMTKRDLLGEGGISSYGDILRDIVDDEFEFCLDQNYAQINQMVKIQLPLQEFENKNVRSLLMESILNNQEGHPINLRDFSIHKNFCPQIDNIVMHESANPLKRAKVLENCVYAPIPISGKSDSGKKYIGLIQIANSAKSLEFGQQDLKFLKIICQSAGAFLERIRQAHHERINVQRRLDATMLSSQLEGSQTNQILVLSNKLFLEKANPFKALVQFLNQAQKYLAGQFNCEAAQILLVDKTSHKFMSLDDLNPKNNCLIERGSTKVKSVANHAIMSDTFYCFPAVNISNLNQSILDRGDLMNGNQSLNLSNYHRTNQTVAHLSFIYNSEIDAPLTMNTQYRPSSYMCQAVIGYDQSVLAVIQLIEKKDTSRFNEQDVATMQTVADQMGQVLHQVNEANFLDELPIAKFKGAHQLADVFQKKRQSHMKQFFFELIAIRYGKNVVLKNKIIRKQLDHRMELDQGFVKKTQKLMALAEKFSRKTKKATINRLNGKLAEIQDARRKNAEKSFKILNKYQKLLTIRVKDKIFHQWIHKLRTQHKLVNPSSVLSGSLRNSQIHFTDLDFTESGSYLQSDLHTSVVSGHLMKAKVVYKLKKLFNKNKLQVAFDSFVIKVFQNYKRGIRILREGKQRSQLRNVLASQIFQTRFMRKKKFAFNTMWTALKDRKQATFRFRRAVVNRERKVMLRGFQRWKFSYSLNYRQQARDGEMLLRQSKENEVYQGLFQLILRETNNVFEPIHSDDHKLNQTGLYRTAEECFQSNNFQEMMSKIFKYIDQTSSAYPFQSKVCIEQDGMVFNFALPPSQQQNGLQFAQISFAKCPQRTQTQKYESRQNDALSQHSDLDYSNQNRTFCSINDVLSDTVIQFKQQQNLSQSKEVNVPAPPSHKYAFSFESATSDALLQTIGQVQKGFHLQDVLDDERLKEPVLRRRQISNKTESVLVVPIKDEVGRMSGSLEIYYHGEADQMYWLEKYEKFGEMLGFGLKQFMVQLINKLSIQSNLIQSQLSYEISSFMPAQLQSLVTSANQITGGIYEQTPIKFTKLVYELDLMVKKAFKADTVRIIFLPYQSHVQSGIFMEGPFENRELFQIHFQNSIVNQIFKEKGCSQITVPSSLICQKSYSSIDVPDVQYDIKGQEHEALKYLTIGKAHNSLFGVIEIGWHYLQEAQLVHENLSYVQKKEDKVVSIARETINQTYIKLKLMTGGIKQKNSYEQLRLKLRGFFLRWKRLTYFEQFADHHSDFGKRDQENSMLHSNYYGQPSTAHQLDASQDKTARYSPMLPIQNISQDMSINMRKGDMSTANPSAYNSLFTPQRANLAPYRSLQREKQVLAQTYQTKKQTETMKNSMRIINIIQKKQLNTSELRSHFNQWQMFMKNARLAETAFEQLLEIHQKHSRQRYLTAATLLKKIDSRVRLTVGLEKIVEHAVSTMQEETVQQQRGASFNMQNQSQQSFNQHQQTAKSFQSMKF